LPLLFIRLSGCPPAMPVSAFAAFAQHALLPDFASVLPSLPSAPPPPLPPTSLSLRAHTSGVPAQDSEGRDRRLLEWRRVHEPRQLHVRRVAIEAAGGARCCGTPVPGRREHGVGRHRLLHRGLRSGLLGPVLHGDCRRRRGLLPVSERRQLHGAGYVHVRLRGVDGVRLSHPCVGFACAFSFCVLRAILSDGCICTLCSPPRPSPPLQRYARQR
jgi:hypothetical protein